MSNRYQRDETDVNYRYFVHFVQTLAKNQPDKPLRILDYGCGTGQIVGLLREAGYDAYGVEVCYAASDHTEFFNSPLYKGGYLIQIEEDGELPFEDGRFDVIVSNMVFEHINQKAIVFARLKRVLAADGIMQHHFPTRDIWREPHIAVPFAHRLKAGAIRNWVAKGTFRLGGGSIGRPTTLPVNGRIARSLGWIATASIFPRAK